METKADGRTDRRTDGVDCNAFLASAASNYGPKSRKSGRGRATLGRAARSASWESTTNIAQTGHWTLDIAGHGAEPLDRARGQWPR